MRYASLRQGLVGAWCPSVSGPYGYRLPDLSGCGNHGTLTNMDPPNDWVVSGGKGALDFDSTNDYISTGLIQDLSKPLTWSVWAYIVSGDYNQLCGQGNGLATGIYLNVGNSGELYWYSVFAGGYGIAKQNAWNAFAGTYNGATAKLYMNGLEVSSTATWSKTDKTSAFEIGRVNYSGFYYYNGNGRKLDDIRIYNRALTQSEIRLLASERGIGLKPERIRNRYSLPTVPRNRSSRFLGFPA